MIIVKNKECKRKKLDLNLLKIILYNLYDEMCIIEKFCKYSVIMLKNQFLNDFD
ncbi:MAG: hypothetical protein ABH873_10590 [Candidatus Firestonebacteria bacterium]